MSKILLASHPFDGHYGPFTRLGVHLKQRGHDVRWYTGPSYAERVSRLGVVHYPFVRAKEITAFNLGEHLPEYDTNATSPRALARATEQMFFAPIEPQYRDVCEIHRDFPFDALICDAPLFMARMVAEKLEPRVYVISPAPTPAPSSPTAPAPQKSPHLDRPASTKPSPVSSAPALAPPPAGSLMSASRMSKFFRRFLCEGLRGPDPADGERLKFGSSLRGCFSSGTLFRFQAGTRPVGPHSRPHREPDGARHHEERSRAVQRSAAA
jgi:hypothetical protein